MKVRTRRHTTSSRAPRPFVTTKKLAKVRPPTRFYHWFEAVPLRDGKDAMLVNWIGFEIIDAKDRVKLSMA